MEFDDKKRADPRTASANGHENEFCRVAKNVAHSAESLSPTERRAIAQEIAREPGSYAESSVNSAYAGIGALFDHVLLDWGNEQAKEAARAEVRKKCSGG